MKVAFCASEIFPFAKTGGLADVCGALPLALEHFDIEVVMFMPNYRCVASSGMKIDRVSEGISRSKIGKNIDVYLIENKSFFDRDGIYGDGKGDYPDNLERYVFFCQKTLESMKVLGIKPDIIHCHDWQTSLIPAYIKEKYINDPFFENVKTLLTIHNISFQGIFSKNDYSKLGLELDIFHHEIFEFYDRVNLLKGGIILSDEISTVSRQYAKEIQTREFGYGLDTILKAYAEKIVGIVNGVDYSVWDPSKDKFVNENFSPENFNDVKPRNKIKLQQEVGLPENKDIPLFGFVGRLSYQKGIDLLIATLSSIDGTDFQFVIQGVGDSEFAKKLDNLSKRFPNKIKAVIDFEEHIAHQIYAGSDFFLMPSIFEPCGLSQLISLKYGTIPIVYHTGGLIDTIDSFSDDPQSATGFVFEKYDIESFMEAIVRAGNIYKEKAKFQKLINNAFNADFSWDHSAQEYIKLYQTLCGAICR